MRTLTNTKTNTTGALALSILAGWTPSRRGVLGGLLVAGAASAAAGTAAAIAIPAAAAAPTGVSPRLAHLISEYIRLSAELDAVDYYADPDAWASAAKARSPAVEDLVLERPATMIDLAAKMVALSQFMTDEDSERVVFRRLAEDATRLAGEAGK